MKITEQHELDEEEWFGLVFKCPNCNDTEHLIIITGTSKPNYCPNCGIPLEWELKSGDDYE